MRLIRILSENEQRYSMLIGHCLLGHDVSLKGYWEIP